MKKGVKLYIVHFYILPSKLYTHALGEDVSPKDTDAKDDANTRALLAPLWKFLLLLSFNLRNADFKSNTWSACVKSCLDSPKIARFKRGMYVTHKAITLDTMPGHKNRNAFNNTNHTENTRYGSSFKEVRFHECIATEAFSEDSS